MSGNVVNLRHARKQKKRKQKEQNAEQNRISYGLSKQEKAHLNKSNTIEIIRFEQKKLDKDFD